MRAQKKRGTKPIAHTTRFAGGANANEQARNSYRSVRLMKKKEGGHYMGVRLRAKGRLKTFNDFCVLFSLPTPKEVVEKKDKDKARHGNRLRTLIALLFIF